MDLYEWMAIDDLMAWLPALDHLQAIDRTQQITHNAISAGNTSEEVTRASLEYLQSLVIQGKPIRKKRAVGQSPF